MKNEVFARVGYDVDNAKVLYEDRWEPFRNRFDSKFDDFFFPFCVIHKSGASRTEMFGELRDMWRGFNSIQIIDALDEYSAPYLALSGLANPEKEYGKEVGAEVRKLVELGHPTATLPFLMKLLKTLSDHKISKDDVLGCIQTIESFLVRRAICGIEPTGLLGMFRTMWALCDNHPDAKRVSNVIENRLTVEWPSDERLTKAIVERPLYGSSVAKYVILEYERSQSSEPPPSDGMTIEHVMPRAYCDTWSGVITRERHGRTKDLWANLLPLSESLNVQVNQSTYEVKRPYYQDESMFATTRKFGSKYEAWNEERLRERSLTLASWARKRWISL